MLDRNDGAAYREEKRALEADGYVIHLRHAARIIGRANSVTARHATEFGIGRHLRGSNNVGDTWRFRKQEVQELRMRLKHWDDQSWRDPDPGEWGRLAGTLLRHADKPNGRPRAFTEDEAAYVRRLRDEAKTLGRIEVLSGLTRKQIRRILT